MNLFSKLANKLHNNKFELTNSTQSAQYMTTVVNYAGVPIEWSSFSVDAAIKEGYKSNPYIFMAIDKISTASSSVLWGVETKNIKGEWDKNLDHPLNKIIAEPNKNLTFNSLIRALILYLNIGGNFIIHKVRGVGSKVYNWNVVRVDHIKPILDKYTGDISYYQYTTSDNFTHVIQPTDIIHGMFYNPADKCWGLSKIEVLSRIVDSDNAAQEWNKSSMDNRGVPDGLFIIKEADNQFSALDDDDLKEAKQSIRSGYTGRSNGREPWVLSGDITYEQLGLTPVEMDFMETRKFSREVIAGVFGVPLPLLGSMESSSYNNILSMKKSLWQETVIPTLDLILDTLNMDIKNEYDSNTRIMYYLDDVSVMQEDFSNKVKDAVALCKAGYSLESVNKLLGLGFEDSDFAPKSII